MITVSIAHLRECAESRFKVASGLAKSAEVPKRQQWQERGRVADLIRRIRAKTESIRQLRERRLILRSRRRAVERWNAAHKPGDEIFVPGMNARVTLVSEAWEGFAWLPTVRIRFKLGNELAIETRRLAEVP